MPPSNRTSSSFSSYSESVIESLLKNGRMDWEEFLESIWEKQCHRFAFVAAASADNDDAPTKTASSMPSSMPQPTTIPVVCNNGNGNSRNHNNSHNLWSEMVRGGWDVLTHMLDNTHPMSATIPASSEHDSDNNSNSNSTDDGGHDFPPPLLFRDLRPMDDPREIQRLFGTSLYAAYLAGCSIVWNHADRVSPIVEALCRDLQGSSNNSNNNASNSNSNSNNNSGALFPHAYANAYLTPPLSQTVPAHADDRDVLVFQLVGFKHWRVYEKIPVPHPYPHQQVGKSGIPVPDSVLHGPLAFDGILVPGDVLYLPRGMVHEASTTAFEDHKQQQQQQHHHHQQQHQKQQQDQEPPPPDLSFHITVALATHDWTLAGNLSRMIQSQLLDEEHLLAPISNSTSNSGNLRRSLLPTPHTSSTTTVVTTGDGSDNNNNNNNNNSKNQQQQQSQSPPPVSHKKNNGCLVSCGGSLVDANALQEELDAVFETLRSKITARSILQTMNQRIATHNHLRAKETTRMALSATKRARSPPPRARVVGPIAAGSITLDTLLRCSTPSEKEHARNQQQTAAAAAVGLTVRDGVGDDVACIVGAIKGGFGVGAADGPDKDKPQTGTRVGDFRSLLLPSEAAESPSVSSLCDLTALSLAKRAVELGAFAVVETIGDDGDKNDAVAADNDKDDTRHTTSSKRQRTNH